MVPVVAVMGGGCFRRAGGMVRRRVGRDGMRGAVASRPNRVRDPVVHGTRMQRRWFLLNYEGPGRKDRGDRATTRDPHHMH